MQKLKKLGVSTLAAAGATALVLSMSTPALAAENPTFGGLTVSNPGTATVPSSAKGSTKKISVKFNGPLPPADKTYQISYGMYEADFYGPKITLSKKNKKLSSKYVSLPYLSASSSASPTANNALEVKLSRYTTPGKYKITVPVTQHDRRVTPTKVTTLNSTKYLTVRANKKVSQSLTGLSGSGTLGKTWKVSMVAPAYQAGAKVTLYVKAKGKKKYKKVGATKTLKSSNSTYSKTSKLKLPGKYTKKGTKVYVKVKAVAYSGAYKSKPQKIK